MKQLAALAALLACGLAFAREAPPRLQIDVDFFDNLETVRPYCGSNWIDRFFADCQAHGVKRVTWRCFAQIANYMSPTNAQATIPFNQPLELSEVLLDSGHLSWVNKCPVEDCTVEGLRGGAWHSLGALTDANVLKGNNQEVPNVCRFAPQTLEGLRVTVTRGGHPTCLVLRAIQGR